MPLPLLERVWYPELANHANFSCWGQNFRIQYNGCCTPALGGGKGRIDPECWGRRPQRAKNVRFAKCCGYNPEQVMNWQEDMEKLAHWFQVDPGAIDRIRGLLRSLCGDLSVSIHHRYNLSRVQTVWLQTVRAMSLVIDEQVCPAQLTPGETASWHNETHAIQLEAWHLFADVLFGVGWAVGADVDGFLRAAIDSTQVSKNFGLPMLINPYEDPLFRNRRWNVYEHHAVVIHWMLTVGSHNVNSTVTETVDWFGVRTAREISCHWGMTQRGYVVKLPGLTDLNRICECGTIPLQAPLVGEDYFETVTLLRSLISAAPEKGLVVIEAGSGYGVWGVKASIAWRRLHPKARCTLVFIETGAKSLEAMPAHFERNAVEVNCAVEVVSEPATGELIDQLVLKFGRVDLIDMDIQGAELDVLQNMQSLRHVRHLWVGTHSRPIHREVRRTLLQQNWKLEFDFDYRSFSRTPLGMVPTRDGVLAGWNSAYYL